MRPSASKSYIRLSFEVDSFGEDRNQTSPSDLAQVQAITAAAKRVNRDD